jgi:hypothetical protein
MSGAPTMTMPGSRRYADWPRRWAEFLRAERGAAFAWGARDCCLASCNGIRAITGLDLAAGMFRGRYRGATGAVRLLKKHGGVEAIAERQCAAAGFAEWPRVAQARRGDMVLLDTPEGPALGLCDGLHGVFASARGVALKPLGACRRAWRVD